jgi:hypothetical protein
LATSSLRAGDHHQRRIGARTGQLRSVHQEPGQVAATEGRFLRLLGGPDTQDPFGDRLPVSNDKVDLQVVGPGPARTHDTLSELNAAGDDHGAF